LQLAWYPGHMNKAKKLLLDNLKIVDMAVEIRDARVPTSSTNPDIRSMIKDKLNIVLLNKKDYADQAITAKWLTSLSAEEVYADAISCMAKPDIIRVKKTILKLCEMRRREIKSKKGIEKTIRLMVMGIPNVGKSTFINRLTGENKTKTEDKPGVTKGNQWIRIDKYTEVLDTPGILWPKSDNDKVTLRLAYIGSIKHSAQNASHIAYNLIDDIKELYPDALSQRYGLSDIHIDSTKALEQICFRMGCIRTGNTADTETGAIRFLREFQTGKLGKMTFERP